MGEEERAAAQPLPLASARLIRSTPPFHLQALPVLHSSVLGCAAPVPPPNPVAPGGGAGDGESRTEEGELRDARRRCCAAENAAALISQICSASLCLAGTQSPKARSWQEARSHGRGGEGPPPRRVELPGPGFSGLRFAGELAKARAE